MTSQTSRRLGIEALEVRQLLSVTPYRDLTSSQPQSELIPALFSEGDGGYAHFNIPAISTTTTGTVLAFAEARSGPEDTTGYAIVLRRSTDHGDHWSTLYSAVSIDRSTGNINGTCPIVDQVTGDVLLLFTEGTSSVFVIRSSDDGLSWSTPTDITASVKVTAGNNPGPAGTYPNDPWGWYAVGPAHGIQLQNGDHAGRLLAGADHRLLGDDGTSFSHVIYSDDHGQTWHLGGGMDQDHLVNDNSNECTLAELNNGDVYMNIRMQSDSVPYRAYSLSSDGGVSWADANWVYDLPSRSVEGSLLRLNGNVLLLSTLHNVTGDMRHELTIWLSYDEGQTWGRSRVIDFGYAGYSDMTLIGTDTLLLTYTRGRTGGQLFGGVPSTNPAITFEEIALAKINLTWLEATDPYQFDWQFDELPPGSSTPNNPLPVVQDHGQWDQRALIYATAPPSAQYVAGSNGSSAIRLSESDDEVVLSQGDTTALQFDVNDGYTIDATFRTTDTNGVLLGSRPTVKNWTLAIVNGHARFSVFDGATTAAITSDAAVNDGNWHRLIAIHDPVSRRLKLYVDQYSAATEVTDTTSIAKTSADPLDPIVLGAYNDLDAASQLTVDVDRLTITRAALDPSLFLFNSVVGRRLFYAGSKWDTTSHDLAIAPDKSAYRPGTGLAPFSAVTSYIRGINGLMVDIAGSHGTISAADFTFKRGNNNSPGTWTAAAAPTQVNVRAGAGTNGSDRVELIWANNAIQNTWLEVIVRGNDALGGFDTNTGIAASDVFYFGSAMADSGAGDTTGYTTNLSDEQAARNNPHSLGNPATITDAQDYNRDGLVNTSDQQAARNYTVSALLSLKRVNLSGAGPFAPSASGGSPMAIAAAGISPAVSLAVDGTPTTQQVETRGRCVDLVLFEDADQIEAQVRQWLRPRVASMWLPRRP